MNTIRTQHRRRGRALWLSLAVVAALVVAYATTNHSPIDVRAAHAAAAPPRDEPAAATPKDERWSSDESAQGTRPDAVH